MDNEIIKAESNSEEIYTSIRSFVITAQNKVYSAVNTAMVIAYWEIGEQRLAERMTELNMVRIF